MLKSFNANLSVKHCLILTHLPHRVLVANVPIMLASCRKITLTTFVSIF